MSDVQKQLISFENGQQAVSVLAQAPSQAKDIAEALAIPAPKAVILSIGGAEDLSPDSLPRLTQLYSRGIARAAIETGALVIDGGTRAGVMSLMGEGVAARGYRTSLLGVAPAAKITLPGTGAEKGTLLEPNHSHFVLTEGTEWGAETPVLFAMAQWYVGNTNAGTTNPAPGEPAKIPALAVLASGGAVTRQEALQAVRRAIPLIIIEGSGGVADEIAAAWKQKDGDIDDPTLAEIIADGELHFHNLSHSIKGIERLIIRELGNDKVLQQALQTYATYDLNANLQQAYFNKLQLSIIVIGVLSTALVVVQQVFAPPAPENGAAAKPPGWVAVHYLLILLPILLTVLISAANRFKQGNKWLLLRAGAESIKREIYSYRVRSRSNPGEAEQQLAKKLEDITRRTMQTEVNLSALKPYTDAKSSSPHASGAPGGDDGISPLSPDRYVEVRLADQLNYYTSKTVYLEKQLKWLYWSTFAIGGIGAFLAAIDQQLWIALTTALIAAIGTYLGFRQTENTLIKYNKTATDLSNIRAWWYALSAEEQARTQNIDSLVKHTEQVLQTELDGWIQQMQNALAELRKEQEPVQKTEDADSETLIVNSKKLVKESTSVKVIATKKEEADLEEQTTAETTDIPLHQ